MCVYVCLFFVDHTLALLLDSDYVSYISVLEETFNLMSSYKIHIFLVKQRKVGSNSKQ